MSDLTIACNRWKIMAKNQAQIVDMEKKWHDFAMRGSVQTQKLRKLCNTQRKR